ncbi:hypothetical protein CNMCM5793_003834 [Aspergillus hiratsukae]|uniref:RNA helicase HEL117 n=1 Tax=Aspergillus hiratsukae TaxID=1194566 RepID=A0A8H6P2Y5_9EURO|nr:hypothetical protein CNMCM5793_003834 [Aspergillus hiratsukae]KAF7165253.1 hypothetical protein CNMCM6106_001450 [Aspergillus hiratsukae]
MSTRDHRHRERSHRDHDSRSRSRSPDRSDRQKRHHHHRSRHGHHRHRDHSHDRDRHSQPAPSVPVVLPFQARELSKRDLTHYEPMFAMYLDIQKGLIMEDLSEEEIKGRWKSFIRKWNRGELAEGWYDPSTLEKARRNASEHPPVSGPGRRHDSPEYEQGGRGKDADTGDASERTARQNEREFVSEDEDDYGPILPHHELSARGRGGPLAGPTIPTTQDLELRKESAVEDAIAARQDARKQHRAEARSHKSEIRQVEDEIAPRAEPGTHERRMEKRREANTANRAFAEARRGGSPIEAAPDDELMGSGENDLDAIKKAQASEQRKKNEREIRREEILRARAAEREERLQQYRKKEEETIGWLKTLAKQRFG